MPSGYHTSAFLDPGTTAPGAVCSTTVVYRGKTYVARTGVWQGTVHAVSPPTLTGSARFHAAVVPHRAIWTGGWAGLPQPETAGVAGGPPNVDELNVEACRTPTGRHCVNLTRQGRTTAFSRRPPVIDNWVTGWYLFAFDQRIAAPELIAEPGYGTPYDHPGRQGRRHPRTSLSPLGPVTGPPIPRVAILHRAIPRARRVLVARIHCAVRCTASVSVSDRHTQQRGTHDVARFRARRCAGPPAAAQGVSTSWSRSARVPRSRVTRRSRNPGKFTPVVAGLDAASIEFCSGSPAGRSGLSRRRRSESATDNTRVGLSQMCG